MTNQATVIDTASSHTKRGDAPILVIGSTGKTGRRVVERLNAAGYAVREGSRRSDPSFDWHKPETWPAALAGADGVYITYYPDLAVPGAPEAIERLTELAAEAGVQRLVLLSGRGEEHAQRCERIVRDSGIAYTLLRASWFSQNFSENFLLDAVQSGVVALPVGDVKEPFVDADDIADVAVAALTEDGHESRLYELTGPRLLTMAEAVGEIAEAAGRPVRYERVTAEQYAAGLEQAGLPEELASLVMYLFTTVMDGRNASTADGVEQALGRAPRDFADYARETAGAGVWESAR